MTDHKIAWLNTPGMKPRTWNMIYGCSHASEGCHNCYGERMANRQKHIALAAIKAGRNPGKSANYIDVITDGKWNGEVRFCEKALMEPMSWRKPSLVFVESMGDLFHESVPVEWIDKVMAIVAFCAQHQFMFLTKRAGRMREYMVRVEAAQPGSFIDHDLYDHWRYETGAHDHEQPEFPLPNLWLGVTCENQEQADKRIPDLLATPAAHRFVSIEPMLGPVDLERPHTHDCHALKCTKHGACPPWYIQEIDYVICGGESGPGARPIHPDWVRSIRDQCAAAEVPFMFKQWGEWAPFDQEYNYPQSALFTPVDMAGNIFNDAKDYPGHEMEIMARVGKKQAGRLLDGKLHDDKIGSD